MHDLYVLSPTYITMYRLCSACAICITRSSAFHTFPHAALFFGSCDTASPASVLHWDEPWIDLIQSVESDNTKWGSLACKVPASGSQVSASELIL